MSRSSLLVLLLGTFPVLADSPAPRKRAAVDPLFYRDAVLSGAQSLRQREVVRMLSSILGGSRMGPGEGWFGPSQTKFPWKSLATRYDANADGRITPEEFGGDPTLFAVLDRDGNGAVLPDDLDWSERSPYVQKSGLVRDWFGRMDGGDGQIRKAEWDAFFRKAARGKDYLTADDLQEALLRMPRPQQKPDKPGPREKGPTLPILLAGLVNGEIGSMFEGPDVGDRAPNFTLRTHDDKRAISLKDYRGKKPVVLIFGSFT